MRLNELMADVNKRQEEERRRQEAEQVELEQKQADEVAARIATFREWLGELAEDLEMGDGRWVDGRVRLTVRPKGWRSSGGIGVELDGLNRGGFFGRPEHSAVYVDEPYGPRLGEILVEWQQEYEEVLAGEIGRWHGMLVGNRPVEGVELGVAALDRLKELAPEREEDWEAAFSAWLKKDGERARAKREEEEAAAERAALVERFRLAMEAWAEERVAAVEHNRAVVEYLVLGLGEVSLKVREIEYGIVAADDDSYRYAMTRTAWGITDGGNDSWVVVENGRPRLWTFRHIVRVSEAVDVKPESHPSLFGSAWLNGRVVHFTHDQELLVMAALAAIRPVPEEPDWNEMSGGEGWGSDVDVVTRPARERVYAAEKQLALEPDEYPD